MMHRHVGLARLCDSKTKDSWYSNQISNAGRDLNDPHPIANLVVWALVDHLLYGIPVHSENNHDCCFETTIIRSEASYGLQPLFQQAPSE